MMGLARRAIGRFRCWTWAHRSVALALLVLLALAQAGKTGWLRGSPAALRWGEAWPMVDPLAALEVMLAARGTTTAMLLGAGTVTLVALLLGRVFCGWLCPLGLLLELNQSIRDRLQRPLARHRLRLPALALPRSTKYWLLAIGLVAALVGRLPLLSAVSPVNLLVVSLGRWPLVGLGIAALWCAVEWFAPRVLCRALCPLGALHSVLGRWAPLRVRVRADRERLACHRCTMHCPMGIEVMQQHVLAGRDCVDDAECTRCGICADVCAGTVLALGWWSGKTEASKPAAGACAAASLESDPAAR